MGKDSRILVTNLKPFFWKNGDNRIRQNNQRGLEKFLFDLEERDFQDQVEALQNQVFLLQQKVIDLEEKLKYPLNEDLE